MTHYYDEVQTSSEDLEKIVINTKDLSFELFSGSGVFSRKKIDAGSKLLVENALINETDEVLDIGCGIGVVGICVKKFYSQTKIFFSDVNLRALKITRLNIDLTKLNKDDLIVKKSYLFDDIKDKEFDVVLSNPPYAAGRKVCFKLIEDSVNFIKTGGSIQLVARHNKGGKALKQKMLEVFGNAEDLAKGSGFRVYISKKR